MWSDENKIETAFCDWLAQEGWTDIVRASGTVYLDVGAIKDGRKLLAEVKGLTKDTGTSVDIMFGQLLRRMEDPTALYATVVPEGKVLTATLRVAGWVRDRLGISVFAVSEDGSVRLVEG
jgi:hypothetical protein